MKYITYTIGYVPQGSVFSEGVKHSSIAHAIALDAAQMDQPFNLLGAGFCNSHLSRRGYVSELKVEVFGASESLRLSSRPEDAAIIEAFLSSKSLSKPQLQQA